MAAMEFQTTFLSDFSIADKYGYDAILDTYKRVFEEWKTDYIYLTELVIVLNWKCWYHYEHHNQEFSKLYYELYYKTNDYALDHLKGSELEHFYRLTD